MKRVWSRVILIFVLIWLMTLVWSWLIFSLGRESKEPVASWVLTVQPGHEIAGEMRLMSFEMQDGVRVLEYRCVKGETHYVTLKD